MNTIDIPLMLGESGGLDDWIEQGMHVVAIGIGVLGVLIILWGMCDALIRFVGIEVAALRGTDQTRSRETLRHHLAYYLLLGLELLIAADIVETIVAPDLNHLATLGAIVVIRTVISFSLNWELSHVKQHTPGA